MKIVALCSGKLTTAFYRNKNGELKTTISEYNKIVVSSETNSRKIEITKFGLLGDERIERNTQESIRKSILMLPATSYDFWRSRHLNNSNLTSIKYGFLGENMVVEGLDENTIHLGDQMCIEDTILEVTEPRIPNHHFNIQMGYNSAVNDLILSGLCGWYLKVVRLGFIRAGSQIILLPGTSKITVLSQFKKLTNNKQLNLIQENPIFL